MICFSTNHFTNSIQPDPLYASLLSMFAYHNFLNTRSFFLNSRCCILLKYLASILLFWATAQILASFLTSSMVSIWNNRPSNDFFSANSSTLLDGIYSSIGNNASLPYTKLKGVSFCCRLFCGMVKPYYLWKEIYPSFLSRTNLLFQPLQNYLVCSLNLPICLWMLYWRKNLSYSQLFTHASQFMTSKLCPIVWD